jgi:hypothetical protein
LTFADSVGDVGDAPAKRLDESVSQADPLRDIDGQRAIASSPKRTLMALGVWPPAAHRVGLKTPNVSDNTEGRSTH